MEYVPAAKVEVVNVACPDPFSAAVSKISLLSLKETVPVGIGAPTWPVTFAVKVTDCPTFAVVGEICSAVELVSKVVV